MKKFLTLMGLCNIVEIVLVLYLTYWRETFWNFVATKSLVGFTSYLAIFTGVALTLCIVVAMSTYFGLRAAICWREVLNSKAFGLKRTNIENVNQRIQEDCKKYPDLVIAIGGGLIKAIVYIIVFSITLVLNFSWVYLGLIMAYSILSTFIAQYIGYPLIKLNYKTQQAEATYRNTLTKISFTKCVKIQINLARKIKHLEYFQSLYGQLGVIIPLVIIAPKYFTTAMTLGTLMQANSIMSTLTENSSYGINVFKSFNKLLSCRKRLKEIDLI